MLVSGTASAQYDIIPLPSAITPDAKGRQLHYDASTPVTEQLNTKLATAPEGWRISVGKRGITIESQTEAGLFYGRQALRQIHEHIARQQIVLPVHHPSPVPGVLHLPGRNGAAGKAPGHIARHGGALFRFAEQAIGIHARFLPSA